MKYGVAKARRDGSDRLNRFLQLFTVWTKVGVTILCIASLFANSGNPTYANNEAYSFANSLVF